MKQRIKNYYDFICGLAQEYKSKGSTETAEGLSIAADALESHFPFVAPLKVKYGNKVYDVLFTKTEFGEIWYAIEDEPNHIDFVHNVEIVKS